MNHDAVRQPAKNAHGKSILRNKTRRCIRMNDWERFVKLLDNLEVAGDVRYVGILKSYILKNPKILEWIAVGMFNRCGYEQPELIKLAAELAKEDKPETKAFRDKLFPLLRSDRTDHQKLGAWCSPTMFRPRKPRSTGCFSE